MARKVSEKWERENEEQRLKTKAAKSTNPNFPKTPKKRKRKKENLGEHSNVHSYSFVTQVFIHQICRMFTSAPPCSLSAWILRIYFNFLCFYFGSVKGLVRIWSMALVSQLLSHCKNSFLLFGFNFKSNLQQRSVFFFFNYY